MVGSDPTAVTSAAPADREPSRSYYLLKAEPDSRIVKGKDVKFSVEDFEEVKTSPWEGVRNFEARNIMKEMKVGDKALFYHSSCKNPGIAAFSEVSKEAYPDFTAWDPSHPYYDPKTDKENPKWFMVELTYTSRPAHFIPLSLLRLITTIPSDADTLPSEIAYLGPDGLEALKGMDLVTRGRLSVQRVREKEWEAIHKLAERGGWEAWDLKKKALEGIKGEASSSLATKGKSTKGRRNKEDQEGEEGDAKRPSASKRRPKKATPGDSAHVAISSPLTELDEELPLPEDNASTVISSKTRKNGKRANADGANGDGFDSLPEGTRRSKRHRS